MAEITTLDPLRAEAVRWLHGRLQWEATLAELRHPSATPGATGGAEHDLRAA